MKDAILNFGRGKQLRNFCYIYIFYVVFKIPSINPRNTQWKITAPPTCTRQNSVFINKDDEIKHASYCSSVLS